MDIGTIHVGEGGASATATAIASDASGNLFALIPTGGGRVRVFKPDGTFVRQFDTGLSSESIAVGPSGSVYVAATDGIHRFAADGTPLGTFGSGAGKVAVGPDGRVYAIAGSPSSTVVMRYEADGTGGVPFSSAVHSPISIAVGADGAVYVGDADFTNAYASQPGSTDEGVVRVLAPDGALARTIGSLGNDPGQFNPFPRSLAVAGANLYATTEVSQHGPPSSTHDGVEHYATSGAFSDEFGVVSDDLKHYRGLAASCSGDVYAALPSDVEHYVQPGGSCARVTHISGRAVAGADGTHPYAPARPASGVTVQVAGTSASGDPVSVSATTGADGTYDVALANGRYVLTVPDGTCIGGVADCATTASADTTDGDVQIDLVAQACLLDTRRTRVSSRPLCLGIDWKMAETTNFKTPTSVAQAQKRYYPPGYTLILQATNAGTPIDPCPADLTYRWSYTLKRTGQSKVLTDTGCTVTTVVPELGTYQVTVSEINKATGKPTGLSRSRDVKVQQFLLVGGGDSNSSGQGNPPFFNDQCDRSTQAYQYKAAQALEAVDPHTSVEMVFVGCSGSQTFDLYNRHYTGQNPSYGSPLLPQFDDVRRLLTPPSGQTRRKIDAVILSTGVNDLLFGEVVKWCITTINPRGCRSDRVKVVTEKGESTYVRDRHGERMDATVTQRIKQLASRYETVDQHLKQVGPMSEKRVLLTQYPDFATDDQGALCGTNNAPFNSGRTWNWLHQATGELNTAVAATKALQWLPVLGIPGDFDTHGYCASSSNRWFRTLSGAAFLSAQNLVRGGKRGYLPAPFHATSQGNDASAMRELRQLCLSFYGNFHCTGTDYVPTAPG